MSQKVNSLRYRAPLGSHERFVALLLEYFGGQLPGWLAPVQISILPLSENDEREARNLADELLARGLRVRLGEGQGSLGKRIRSEHRLRPFSKVVVGAREAQEGVFKLQLRDREISVEYSQLAEKLLGIVQRPE